MSNDTWLTLSAVADRLDKSDMTISRYLKDGIFPNAFRDGPTKRSPWKIPESDVEDYETKFRRPMVTTE